MPFVSVAVSVKGWPSMACEPAVRTNDGEVTSGGEEGLTETASALLQLIHRSQKYRAEGDGVRYRVRVIAFRPRQAWQRRSNRSGRCRCHNRPLQRAIKRDITVVRIAIPVHSPRR